MTPLSFWDRDQTYNGEMSQGAEHDFDPDLDDISRPEDRPIPPRAWRGLGISLLLLYGPLILGLVLKLTTDGFQFMRGVKPVSYVVDPIVYFALFTFIVHIALVIPLTLFSYPQIRRFNSFLLQTLVLFFLLGAPLVSFAYYRAGKLLEHGIFELLLAVLPGTALAAMSFVRFERRWLITAWLAATVYIPLFCINDLMGPLSTWLAYASRFEFFYGARYVFAVAGVIWGYKAITR